MTASFPPPGGQSSPKIDTTVPHSARIWNYWLGGKDNYPVDQAAGDAYVKTFPGIVTIARTSRVFLARAVRYLAADAGIRQFLDIGTGLPTHDNTHEVAQRVAPESRIMYVDNDPLVLVHARALLTSSAEGACDYIDADLRNPAAILSAAVRTLDLSQPLALMLMQILGHITDDDQAYAIVRELVAALPSGSYLVISDGTNVGSEELDAALRSYSDTGAVPYRIRGPEQIARFFDGLELVEPGVAPCLQWRAEAASVFPPPEVETLGAIGRKP
ncbi:MAG TPA: SAM-dependent methyltransferase [Streptosporangiaceae bacterium]